MSVAWINLVAIVSICPYWWFALLFWYLAYFSQLSVGHLTPALTGVVCVASPLSPVDSTKHT